MKWTLKAIRTNLNLTQSEMAEKLGVSKETYQNYENYKTYPDVPVIKKIIELSNIDFDDIIFLPNQYAKSEDKEV
ncbi:MAG: helix-turn-helix transcriptional regulator [Bacilli bacterium]|nr:helix-turn-helix transcriptional regulator [Bacilli bacterium]